MFDTICTLPLTSDLFAQAIHHSEPIVAVGLAAGHVQAFRLPPVASEDSSNDATSASESGCGQIESAWRTKRHKGSCRTLGFGIDGELLYSAGTDGLVKAAATATGQVVSKIAIPPDSSTEAIDPPSILHVLSPQTLLLATDSSALYLYDLRAPTTTTTNKTSITIASKPQQTHHPHDDYISSLTPLPASDTSTSGFSKQWISTGGTTLAVTDLRRGVLVRSEDQEEELLSSLFVGGLGRRGTSVGEKVLVGGAGGVITLWEKGAWDDQDERIVVDRGVGGGESLDALALLPEGVGAAAVGKAVAVGMGDGRVRFVGLGPNKMVAELSHDEQGEGVVGLGFDVGGRMISGGGQHLKVWHEKVEEEEEEDGGVDGIGKRAVGSDSEEDSEQDEDEESSEEEKGRRRRKKRKRNKGKNKSGGKHVMAFQGLD